MVSSRARRGTAAAVTVLGVVLAGGGYAAADAAGLAPGPLAVAPAVPADPWPDAPGTAMDPSAAAVLEPVDRTGPVPAGDTLAAELDPLLAAPVLGPAVSALVVDGLTGEVLYADNAATAREPASTAKLLTAAAALSLLGPDATLPTRVVAGQAPGEVVLVGGGDVLLGAGTGDPDAVVGHAGLADLADATAEALRAQGRSAVALRLDDSLFTGPRTAPGWSASDVANGYVAPVTALAVDAGRTRPEPYAPRVADPAQDAARTFARLLEDRGLAVTSGTQEVPRSAAPAGAQVLAEVRSAPLGEVAAHALQVSDNTVAEALGRLAARASGRPATFTGATQAVLAQVSRLGVDVDGTVLADTSGLADGSAVPARVLADVLTTAAGGQVAALRPLLDGLPVAGLTGSLAQRFTDAPAAEGVVRAKTGTLSGVTSLAGTVVDADGRLLVFVVLADHAGAMTPARVAADRVAAAIAACGCR